jgi:hypothetical protein
MSNGVGGAGYTLPLFFPSIFCLQNHVSTCPFFHEDKENLNGVHDIGVDGID